MSDEIVLRGDKECPHGHTARRKCVTCDHEDDVKEARNQALREVKKALDFEKISEPPGGERRLMVEFILRWFGEGGKFEVQGE